MHTRRDWLITVSTGLAALACGREASPPDAGVLVVAPPSGCPFPLPASVSALGHAWLAANPAEAKIEVLSQALFEQPTPLAPKAALAALGRRRADDLAAGHLVDVNGWLLPPSEARACALVCLIEACEVPPPPPPSPKQRARQRRRRHQRGLGPLRSNLPRTPASTPPSTKSP